MHSCPNRNLYRRSVVESLETRRLLSLAVASPIGAVSVPLGSSAGNVDISNTFANSDLTGDTIVQMQTSEGTIDLQLYNSQTPITVANFLSYVNSGAYNNTLIYRAAKNPDGSPFVVQTGADYPVDVNNTPITTFTDPSTVVYNITQPTTTPPTIQNEYSDSRPNVEGTIAMAKRSAQYDNSGDLIPGTGPDSATTEWFINLADNSENLDNQNGGFTVFGKVIGNGMTVAQTIDNLPTLGGSGPYSALPLVNFASGNVEAGNLVLVPSFSVIPAITYTVSSSNTNVVTTALNGTGLALTYGQPGTANVTVTATDVLGNMTSDVFAVTVQTPSLSVLHNGTLLTSGQSAPINFGFLPLNATASQTINIQNNGDEAIAINQILVSSGFSIVGSTPASVAPGSSASIVLSVDTTSATMKNGTLSIDTNDPNTPVFTVPLEATVAYSTTIGTAASTKAKSFSYTDTDGTVTTITLTGPGTLTPFFFSDSEITQTAGKKGTTIGGTNLLLEDLQIDSTTAKSKLTITSKGGDGISVIVNLDASAALNAITAKGVEFTNEVNFVSLNSLSIASANGATLSGQAITTLSLGQNSNFNLDLSGSSKTISSKGTLSGIWTLSGLTTLSATALSNFNLTTPGSVTTITSKGAITNSTINLAKVKTFSAASMSGSQVNAGYTGLAFPPTAGSIAASSAISAVHVKGIFADSDIVADSLGAITLGSVTLDNDGDPFGLADSYLQSLVAHTGGKAIKLSKLNSTNAAAAIAQLGNLADFQIDIL